MITHYLAATIALAMITGVALGQSPSLTTASSNSSVHISAATSEKSAPPTSVGNGIVGQFWTSKAAQFPGHSDDVPKTVQFPQPVSETASR